MELSRARYLQVLPPHVDGGKGELHLFPARVLVSFVRNLNEDEEDPGDDAASHQHEHTCGGQVSHVSNTCVRLGVSTTVEQDWTALSSLKIEANMEVPKPCILSTGQKPGCRNTQNEWLSMLKRAEFKLNITVSTIVWV